VRQQEEGKKEKIKIQVEMLRKFFLAFELSHGLR
jgi:hypothetical protein